MAKRKGNKPGKRVEALRHAEAKRTNIPTAEYQPVLDESIQKPVEVRYERGVSGLEEEKARRNRDLDPQLVWRGKDEQDWSDLVVHAPPLYIQEKVHPKALIDDLKRQSEERAREQQAQPDLFADFNGIPDEAAKTEFYQHEANWTNRMILGDSLQVMASLAEREGLRGKVQCIYFDPPYGIKFNSNFQWSTTSRDVKDGKPEHITREPEQVKAFRDTWRDGIHSYLTYLRDRLTVCRDLLNDSGSIFVQIGDENVHRVRALMDEVFGEDNFCGQIYFKKTSGAGSPGELKSLAAVGDYLLWYARDFSAKKFHAPYLEKFFGSDNASAYRLLRDEGGYVSPIRNPDELSQDDLARIARIDNITSQSGVEKTKYPVVIEGRRFTPNKGVWKTSKEGMGRLLKATRVSAGKTALGYVRLLSDFAAMRLSNNWDDTSISGASVKLYVVQTTEKVIQRCILMTTDPGDLVLDPTCGSGTTAYVAEQWGRRWITIDTSRVALALARARIMGARYPYYLLADSPEGRQKEAEITGKPAPDTPTHGDIRHGFVYKRVPHITLKSIANNAEIDVIWERFEEQLKPVREELTKHLPDGWLDAYRAKQNYDVEVPPEIQEWEIPREFPEEWPAAAQPLHEKFWELRIARQKEIDESIARNADFEYLYDKPYVDNKRVRVAGPFTVESLSPHRVLGVDENDELIDSVAEPQNEAQDFVTMILENLRTAGVQQVHKEDKIDFVSLTPWPGQMICAEGRYEDAQGEKRAAIFIGPEFGTVSRPDLVEAAREAADAGFDVLIACAFSYDPHVNDLDRLGRMPVLKARMNAELHMAADLKGKGNLFVIFGEPDIDIIETDNDQIRVRVNGVDVFHPQTGEVRSDGPEGIACWFIDTDYNQESFFVRQAYFLGMNDPYKALKTTLKAEIDREAWESLHSNVSRPFPKPKFGRIAVKVINHLGDEVMKVFRIE